MRTAQDSIIRLAIPESAWEDNPWDCEQTHGAPDRMLAQVVINGTYHHLEAYRVSYRENGELYLSNPKMEDELMPTLQELYDGAYETVKINGFEYVLFMFPHAA